VNYAPKKRCAICGEMLDITAFCLNTRGQRHSYCKPCHKLYTYRHYVKKAQARMLGA